jgi:predicted nucleic acid-binding protein
MDRRAALCEPVAFEMLRFATMTERPQIMAQFSTLPLLPSPPTLWRDAARLGQACRDQGVQAGFLDLLIASIAIHHDVELVTFDSDFTQIAKASGLKVILLPRDPE